MKLSEVKLAGRKPKRSVRIMRPDDDLTNHHSLHFSHERLDSLLGSPNVVPGSFDCSNNQLVSLDNCPQTIGVNFNCSTNTLRTLSGGPKNVGGDYDCSENKLSSLLGVQPSITGRFDCSSNKLKTLVGGPKRIVSGYYTCRDNMLLTSLEGVASNIGGSLNCYQTSIKSFHLIHKQIQFMKTFHGPTYPDSAYSHVLGLLLIEGLSAIFLGTGIINDILNKHLKNPNKKQRMLLAQQELIERGFDRAAQL